MLPLGALGCPQAEVQEVCALVRDLWKDPVDLGQKNRLTGPIRAGQLEGVESRASGAGRIPEMLTNILESKE
jgi:hypothetical protein